MTKKKINEATKKHFEEEIEDWKVKILEKQHEMQKIAAQRISIQESLDIAAKQETNKILAAEAAIADYKFDFENQVTFKRLGIQYDQAEKEIELINKNIEARKYEIGKGVEVESRDEKARREIKEKHGKENN